MYLCSSTARGVDTSVGQTTRCHVGHLFHAKISQSSEFGTNWIPEEFFRKKNNNEQKKHLCIVKQFFGHFS